MQFVKRTRTAHGVGVLNGHDLFKHRPRKIESYRRGYPRLSAFVDSDRNFVMFRSFGRLHARILLHKQDELVELEDRLGQIDTQETTGYYLACRRQDQSNERRTLLKEAEKTLEEYNKLLASYYQNIERPKPSPTQVSNVSNWMDGNKPLVENESTFLGDWDDLRSPRNPTDHSGLDVFLGTLAVASTRLGVNKLFAVPPEHRKSDDQHILIHERSQILAASRFLTAVFAVASLTIPIVVLNSITTTTARLWTLTIFTAMFASILSWLTESRNYEILAATAAYCAVMVVFIGNLPGQVGGSS